MRRQTHLDHKCQRCGTGTILSGMQSQYNARSNDGTIICADCKLDELMGRYEPVQN